MILPCSNCRGLCCGPVPITRHELINIKKSIKSMNPKNRMELKNQDRHFGTCIFYDLKNDKCGIHFAKPSICRAFGYYRNLICFRNPEAAIGNSWDVMELPAGVLSVDFIWTDFE